MKPTLSTTFIILLMWGMGFSQNSGDAIRIQQNELGFGARDLAMGGNGVASSGDYSSIYWNPAALASLKYTQISGELSHLRLANSATFANNLNDMENSSTRFRNFGIAIPLPTTRGSLVLALGYNHVKDFDDYLYFSGFNRNSNGLEFELKDENGTAAWYPFDRSVRQTEEVHAEGGLHQWSFGGAIALSPNFDVGASLNFWRGRENYNLQFYQEDVDNIYTEYPGDFDYYRLNHNLITDYQAFSAKLGSIIRLNRFAQVGLAVEFPTTFTLTEEYSSNDELAFDDGYIDAFDYDPGTWQYQVQTPYRFDAGVSLHQENLSLTAGVTYRDWKQTRFKIPEFSGLDADYNDLLAENLSLQKDYRETMNYHVGGEIVFPRGNLSLRGGYAVHPSPLKNATSDMDRKIYSGGIGFRIGYRSFLDVTYLRSSWTRETEDIYTPGGTSEDITENRLLVGIRFSL